MVRKPILLGAGVVALLAAGAGVAVAALLKHEPEFYRHAGVPPGPGRHKLSVQFVGHFAQFYQDVTSHRQWRAQFRQDGVNSFFQEQLVPDGWAKRILPEGASEPRVAIRSDRISIAFRYHLGFLSTVISIDMRVWLAARDANAVVLELRGLHAGALPIAAQSLLERLSEVARQNNIELTWYRHEGNPVALLRFQADQDRPTFRLEHLVLKDKAIEIRGGSSDARPFRTTSLGAKP